MRDITVLIVFCWVAPLGGCVNNVWNGDVETWGTLRGVLHVGDTSGKIRLKDVAGPHRVGIGTPERLAGEIVILDGDVWVSQSGDQRVPQTRHPAPPDTTATFLAVATVPRWINNRTNEGLSIDELEKTVRAAAVKNGLNPASPFPFLVEGRFSDIRLHILNGQCPFAQRRVENDPAHLPIRIQTSNANGILVGFYDEGPPGFLTHAGTHIHLHALLQDDRHTVGHVEAVSVETDAAIRCANHKTDSPSRRVHRRIRRRRIQPIPSSIAGIIIIPSMPPPQQAPLA